MFFNVPDGSYPVALATARGTSESESGLSSEGGYQARVSRAALNGRAAAPIIEVHRHQEMLGEKKKKNPLPSV